MSFNRNVIHSSVQGILSLSQQLGLKQANKNHDIETPKNL